MLQPPLFYLILSCYMLLNFKAISVIIYKRSFSILNLFMDKCRKYSKSCLCPKITLIST